MSWESKWLSPSLISAIAFSLLGLLVVSGGIFVCYDSIYGPPTHLALAIAEFVCGLVVMGISILFFLVAATFVMDFRSGK